MEIDMPNVTNLSMRNLFWIILEGNLLRDLSNMQSIKNIKFLTLS